MTTTAPTTPDTFIFASGEVAVQGADDQGKQARVEIMAYSGGAMRVVGFGAVVVDLAGMEIPDRLSLLADHRATVEGIVGSAEPVVERGRLLARGTLTTATEAGRTLAQLGRDGVALQASIGATPIESRFVREGESVQANGRTITAGRGGLRFFTRSQLREISILPIGADSTSSASIAARGNTMPATADNSVDATTTNPIPSTVSDDQAQTIERICAGQWSDGQKPQIEELRIKAHAGDLSVPQLRDQVLAVVRKDRPAGGYVRGDSNLPDTASILEASAVMSCGVGEKFIGEQYGEAVTHEALSARHRGASFHTILNQVLRAAGRHEDIGRVTDSTVRAAFEADRSLRASGFSTLSLPGILSNTANKVLLATYRNVATVWSMFCDIANVSDFKEHERYRLVGSGQMEEVGAGGEIKHISLTEQKYTNQADTVAAMIGVTRKMLINDDLGAFAQNAQIMARLAATKLEKVVFTKLLSNPSSFFSAGNNNLKTGSNTALGIDSLTTAEQTFRDQVDDNGDPILVDPQVLLVPTALSATARTLVNSQEIRPGGSDSTTKFVVSNPHYNRYSLATTPWLNAQSLAGSSAKAWYLFSNPASLAAMEVAFLNGRQAPTVESGEADFNTLGMQMRAYFDFGVAMRDHRAAVKMKGEA